MATVKITNILTQAISTGSDPVAFISPTCVPNPCTPIEEYVNDMVTITDGVLTFPAYNKFQTISVPFNGYVEFEVTDYKEIAYYESLQLAGATVEVTDGITTVVESTDAAVEDEGTGE